MDFESLLIGFLEGILTALAARTAATRCIKLPSGVPGATSAAAAAAAAPAALTCDAAEGVTMTFACGDSVGVLCDPCFASAACLVGRVRKRFGVAE